MRNGRPILRHSTLTVGADETILTGTAHDQAELFGVLLKIRDLGLKLVSVNPVSR